MAAAPSPFVSSKETTNYARLCRLLVDLGSKALRDTFDKVHPPSTLEGRLLTHKPTLQPLYAGFIGKKKVKKVLYSSQWGKLYPVCSPVTSASFDITLLTVLLRKICGFSAPAKGWDNLPPSTDISTADDIARVNYYRNTVYGHANQASVDDASFNAYWSEICEVLVRLGGTSFRGYINNLEHDTMDPDMEEHYREVMKQWKKDEDSIKEKLEEMEENLRDKFAQMKGEMVNLGERLENSLENLRLQRGESDKKELPPESEEEDEEAITIMEQPSSQKIKEGLNVELVFKCKARGNSKLTYQWYKDGNMLQRGDEGTLVLKSVTLLDFGCYNCVASCEDSPFLRMASWPAELDVTPRDGTVYKRLIDIDFETIHWIGTRLIQTSSDFRGWLKVLGKYKMRPLSMKPLMVDPEAGAKTLEYLQARHPDLTVYDFCKTLKEQSIRRLDIVRILQKHLSVPTS